MTIKNLAQLALLLLGAACALVGLAELSRLVVLHCLSTGWKVKFYLELTAYVVGAVWVLCQFYEGVKNRI
ncbi:hypothetical protein AKJ40_04250 [candidate division MSBL1 archaeon SCGC-AAA259M10]|uniref:Uncharacterized protein n=2 Tax=candidate division MSBL1 TaxID=215777 RepID=A0A656YWH3_9EURY|nr:hypothetical protein AKJ39_01800 [candidate division MSBL1 archaeon SCGC-AAA259J03]KXA98981.1 hypothetical protein AKJ40_04250 [candidate division MSBL1 archaeon SCGC-AAA259M10]